MNWAPEGGERPVRYRRRYRPSDTESLRRFTTAAIFGAIALNMFLFFQIAVSQINANDVSNALVQLATAIFPGTAGIHSGANVPRPTPGGQPVVTTGGS